MSDLSILVLLIKKRVCLFARVIFCSRCGHHENNGTLVRRRGLTVVAGERGDGQAASTAVTM